MVKRIIKWSKSKSTLSDKMLVANNGSLVSLVFFAIFFISMVTTCIFITFKDVPDIIFYGFMVLDIISFLLIWIFDYISA